MCAVLPSKDVCAFLRSKCAFTSSNYIDIDNVLYFDTSLQSRIGYLESSFDQRPRMGLFIFSWRNFFSSLFRNWAWTSLFKFTLASISPLKKIDEKKKKSTQVQVSRYIQLWEWTHTHTLSPLVKCSQLIDKRVSSGYLFFHVFWLDTSFPQHFLLFSLRTLLYVVFVFLVFLLLVNLSVR